MKKIVKRIIVGLLISIVLIGASTGAGAIAAGTKKAEVTVDKKSEIYAALTTGKMFNAEYYAANNPDVVEVMGGDYESLLTHFITYGIFEGRQPNADFNVNAYATAYADLREAFNTEGKDVKQLVLDYYLHYITYGKYEERELTTPEKLYAVGLKVLKVGSSNELYIATNSAPVAPSGSSAGSSSGSSSGTTSGTTSKPNLGTVTVPNAGGGSYNPGEVTLPTGNKIENGNTQEVTIEIKEGITRECTHNSTYTELVLAEASPSFNGSVAKLCNLCNTKFETKTVHAYSQNEYYDADKKQAFRTGWILSRYDGTTNSACGSKGLEVINLINTFRRDNGKTELIWGGKPSQDYADIRAVECSVVTDSTRPSGDAWNSGNSEYTMELINVGSPDANTLFNALKATQAGCDILLSAEYHYVVVSGFHYFAFPEGSHIPNDTMFWVIEFK